MSHKSWSLLKSVDERVGFSSFSYPIPKYANTLLYMLGGVTLFTFLILIGTGIFLSQYYNPDPLKAHDSVVYIMTKVPFGAYIRSVHLWSSQAAIILLIAHVLRVFITGSYKKPREATWLTGVILLIITVAFLFTGTVLKWDQESVEALSHNEAVGNMMGVLGGIFTSGFSQTSSLLTRIYNAHVSILLMLLGVILLAHLYLIKKHGISPKASFDAISKATKGLGNSRFTNHIQILTGYGFITYSILGTLALFFPASIGYQGINGVEVTKPPWFFLPLYAVENFFGIKALIWAPVVLIIVLVIIPFIDRSEWVSPFRRKVIVGLGLIFFIVLIILGFYAYFAPGAKHLMGSEKDSSYNFSFPQLVKNAYAHGGSEEPMQDMTTPNASNSTASSESMVLELNQSLSQKAIIVFTILLSFQMGLILIKEGHSHEK